MRHMAWILAILLLPAFSRGQARVTGHVDVKHAATAHGGDSANVVISLVPLDDSAPIAPPEKPFRLAQKDKTFEPHLLVIPVGSTVDFPNFDPFFHNVFSLYNGKRFDLGLYEAGSSRSVRFTRTGVSYIFCNIHPEMSAVVVTLSTPYYAVSDASGNYAIDGLPKGRYSLRVWYERASANELARLTREVTVESSAALPSISIAEAANLPVTHKNKYGQDYDTTAPYGPVH